MFRPCFVHLARQDAPGGESHGFDSHTKVTTFLMNALRSFGSDNTCLDRQLMRLDLQWTHCGVHSSKQSYAPIVK
jgi:hypothetical protein